MTLLIENAGSNGPRPLTYSFDIATDTGFSNKVFARDGIAQGDGGRTSLRMTDTLATGHTYYWRVRAQDGANTGPYATPASFDIFTPIVIDVPGLTAPAPNSTVLNLRPTFTMTNSPRSGTVGAITYLIELADSDSYANKVATWTAAETPNQTNLVSPVDLAYGKVYYWHARAYDPTTLGPWSNTQAFQMLAQPAPVYHAGTVSAERTRAERRDQHEHRDHPQLAERMCRAGRATTTLTRLDLMPSGAHVEFDKQSSWPEVTPPGWAGGLQYTLWIVLNINGQWHASGCIEYWKATLRERRARERLRDELVLRSDPLGTDDRSPAGARRAGRLPRDRRRCAKQRTEQREGTIECRDGVVSVRCRPQFCVLNYTDAKSEFKTGGSGRCVPHRFGVLQER